MLPLTVNTAAVIVSEAVPDKVIFPPTLQLEVRLIAPEDEEIPLAGQLPGVMWVNANAAIENGGAPRLSQEIARVAASVAFFAPAMLDEIDKNCAILDNPFRNHCV